MTKSRKTLLIVLAVIAALILLFWWLTRGHSAELPFGNVTGLEPELAEPQAETIPTVKIAEPVGWAKGAHPQAAKGLEVTRFAEGLEHPRIIYTLPNGDVLAALTRAPEASAPSGITGMIARHFYNKAGAGGASPNQIMLLRDKDGDGRAEQKTVLLAKLNSPSGIAWAEDTLYIANHDALLAFPYALGADKVGGPAKKLTDLPAAGHHWMRNIIHCSVAPMGCGDDGAQLYIAIGSASNIGEYGMEAEEGRAAVWEYNLKTGSKRPFAVGLRNPNGLAYNPASGELWTTVNERDMLGSDLVPDYLTNVPVGAQYGWPWVYWKNNFDRRVEAPAPEFMVEYTRRPEVALGPHVAALGLVFPKAGHRLGKEWSNGAFIAQHGSWNRKPFSGYNVVYVPFDERGNPTGKPVPLVTGFLTGDGKTHGRPTWLAWAGDGALLLSDDTAGIIWRVIDPAAEPAAAIPQYQAESLPPLKSLDGLKGSFSEDYARRNPPR